ncbi:hypothetical protein ElyMa_002569500 [Elysia marginata]|uniref:Uncharacterized protein n=1 Tax=Elysia marginata TaxID=1093978 RepID=A0AAV4GZ11_9GAST|nr:hypothetical protein ElyMa_002569500 [Elysia marginata]
MNIMMIQISKRLWVRGCRNVHMANHPGWEFFYSLSGGENTPHRSWFVLFYNRDLCVAKLRSTLLDLCVQGVYIQHKQYFSNIYCLSMERVWLDASIWQHANNNNTPPGKEVTYTCTPPVLIKDRIHYNDTKIQLKQSHAGGYFVTFINSNEIKNAGDIHLWSIGGYLGHSGNPVARRIPQHQRDEAHNTTHHPMSWIPTLSVNTATMECKFVISFNRTRDPKRCLQCSSHVDDCDPNPKEMRVLNNHLSQLLLNH